MRQALGGQAHHAGVADFVAGQPAKKKKKNREVGIVKASTLTEKHITQLKKSHTPKISISDKAGGHCEPAQLHPHRRLHCC